MLGTFKKFIILVMFATFATKAFSQEMGFIMNVPINGHSIEMHSEHLIDPSNVQNPELNMMARVIWSEQRQSHTGGVIGMRATSGLIFNRVESERYPDNITGVVKQKAAFSGINPNTNLLVNIPNKPAENHAYAVAMTIANEFMTAHQMGWPRPYNYENGAVLTYTPDSMCSHVKDRICEQKDLVPNWNFELLEQTADIKGTLYFRYIGE